MGAHALEESGTLELTSKITVIALIVLFLVVVFVLFLHLYAKWFWWRIDESTAHPHRRHRRRLDFSAGHDLALQATQHKGFDPALLISLPVLVYHPKDFKDGLECAVCLSELVPGEKARVLPKCNHGFHIDCIDMWFQSHATCPLCRNSVAPESFNSEFNTRNENDFHLGENEDFQSPVRDLQFPNLPTNVLIWGNQNQGSSPGDCLEEEASSASGSNPSSTSDSSSSSTGNVAMLVIDIPCEFNSPSLSLSPSANRPDEQELKSSSTTKLKSFKRLLGGGKRGPPSPASVDIEQVVRVQG